MKFKVNGRELDASGMRVREVCEAEKALGVAMDDPGLGSKMAVALFVAMRRAEPEKPVSILADEVMAVDMTSFEEDEAGPPAEPPVADAVTGAEDRESLPTGGRPLSGVSA